MEPNPDILFKALSDLTRRAIFERLVREGEQNVRSLTDSANVSQPMVSKHLAILKQAGLVRDRADGRSVCYSAVPQNLTPLVDWMTHYGAFWNDRLDALESLLNRMDQ